MAHNVMGYLPSCRPTSHMDEDLAYLHPDSQALLTYSITIHHIKLKSYQLTNGKLALATVRLFPWHQHELGEILFSTVDLLCVRLTTDPQRKGVRVFRVHEADRYVDVGPCDNFYPSRLGYNTYSDGTGFFAITDPKAVSIQIHSLGSTYSQLATI